MSNNIRIIMMITGRVGGRAGGPTFLRLCCPLVSCLVIVLQVLKRVMIKSPEVSSP